MYRINFSLWFQVGSCGSRSLSKRSFKQRSDYQTILRTLIYLRKLTEFIWNHSDILCDFLDLRIFKEKIINDHNSYFNDPWILIKTIFDWILGNIWRTLIYLRKLTEFIWNHSDILCDFLDLRIFKEKIINDHNSYLTIHGYSSRQSLIEF